MPYALPHPFLADVYVLGRSPALVGSNTFAANLGVRNRGRSAGSRARWTLVNQQIRPQISDLMGEVESLLP
ncbi:hypothetical protein CH296_10205 [Rhodococcus sp. 14-2496-1d]|nr:hypothetical protein CH296_10205 [Rhodococcus sp. 14-2496-1d]